MIFNFSGQRFFYIRITLLGVFSLLFSSLAGQTNVSIPEKYKVYDSNRNDTISITELQDAIENTLSNKSHDKKELAILNALASVMDKNTGIVQWWLLEEKATQLNIEVDTNYYYIYTLTDSVKKPVLRKAGINSLTIKHKLNGDIVYYKDSTPVFIDRNRDRILAKKDSALETGAKVEDRRDNYYSVAGAVTGLWQNYSPLKTERNGDGSFEKNPTEQYLSLITLSIDFNLWKGGYINVSPEIAVGNGLGDGAGLASYPNSLYGFPGNKPYLLKTQLRQNFDFSANTQNKIQSIDIIAGRVILQEMFDVNPYANDPRHDFLNFMHNMQGAWDASTTAYGYTHGVAVNTAFKKGFFNIAAVSVNDEAGGPATDKNFQKGYSINAQYVYPFVIAGRNGSIRIFAFYNKTLSGSYDCYGFNADSLASFENLRE